MAAKGLQPLHRAEQSEWKKLLPMLGTGQKVPAQPEHITFSRAVGLSWNLKLQSCFLVQEREETVPMHSTWLIASRVSSGFSPLFSFSSSYGSNSKEQLWSQNTITCLHIYGTTNNTKQIHHLLMLAFFWHWDTQHCEWAHCYNRIPVMKRMFRKQ